ncbi:hypothetical protein Pelo_18999 [Pelomyxa schiedti]|nr:hypothetical protein Pelo_18999 [Pelomyxa schiedti]
MSPPHPWSRWTPTQCSSKATIPCPSPTAGLAATRTDGTKQRQTPSLAKSPTPGKKPTAAERIAGRSNDTNDRSNVGRSTVSKPEIVVKRSPKFLVSSNHQQPTGSYRAEKENEDADCNVVSTTKITHNTLPAKTPKKAPPSSPINLIDSGGVKSKTMKKSTAALVQGTACQSGSKTKNLQDMRKMEHPVESGEKDIGTPPRVGSTIIICSDGEISVPPGEQFLNTNTVELSMDECNQIIQWCLLEGGISDELLVKARTLL